MYLMKRNSCFGCDSKNGVVNIADCDGDQEGPYCKQCWIKWLNEKIFPLFEEKQT